jgi:hypothetical protein
MPLAVQSFMWLLDRGGGGHRFVSDLVSEPRIGDHRLTRDTHRPRRLEASVDSPT